MLYSKNLSSNFVVRILKEPFGKKKLPSNRKSLTYWLLITNTCY